jgi:hypothetical protein
VANIVILKMALLSLMLFKGPYSRNSCGAGRFLCGSGFSLSKILAPALSIKMLKFSCFLTTYGTGTVDNYQEALLYNHEIFILKLNFKFITFCLILHTRSRPKNFGSGSSKQLPLHRLRKTERKGKVPGTSFHCYLCHGGASSRIIMVEPEPDRHLAPAPELILFIASKKAGLLYGGAGAGSKFLTETGTASKFLSEAAKNDAAPQQ